MATKKNRITIKTKKKSVPQKDTIVKKNTRNTNFRNNINRKINPNRKSQKSQMPAESHFTGNIYSTQKQTNIISFDIPDCYNENYLRALPRDPEWTFIYWELTQSAIDNMRKKMREKLYKTSKRILRLLDITDIDYNGSNAWWYLDTEINQYANNWYLKIPQSGRTYVLELGHLASDGSFWLLVRSNIFSVPRGTISESIEEIWKNVNSQQVTIVSAETHYEDKILPTANIVDSDIANIVDSDLIELQPLRRQKSAEGELQLLLYEESQIIEPPRLQKQRDSSMQPLFNQIIIDSEMPTSPGIWLAG